MICEFTHVWVAAVFGLLRVGFGGYRSAPMMDCGAGLLWSAGVVAGRGWLRVCRVEKLGDGAAAVRPPLEEDGEAKGQKLRDDRLWLAFDRGPKESWSPRAGEEDG
jgi:hypothetical protein